MVVRTPIIVVVDDPDDDGARADVVLGRRVAGLSRRVARTMALQGRMRIGGRPAPPSTRVRRGDRLELTADAPSLEPPDVSVLAVTDDLVYVDKPAGLHTHRLRPDDPPALADAVGALHPECATASPQLRQGGALHRLDRVTSGVVCFARHRRAWTLGRQSLPQPSTVKLYVALCAPPASWPPPGAGPLPTDAPAVPALPSWVQSAAPRAGLIVAAPLGHGASRDIVAVRPDGQPAQTIVWPLAALRWPGREHAPCWWVAMRLLTGRRHQARVHLSHLGMPIVGDAKYGSSASEQVWLRACSLGLASTPGLAIPGRIDAPIGPGWTERLTGARMDPVR